MPAIVVRSLDPFFKPRSVAVVGASAVPGSVGSILIRNLIENPFGGVVYPVNPKRKAVHGVLCYPSLAAVPEPVDLAVIATPAGTVPGVVRECAERGTKAVIVISAGFSELGAEGKRLQAEVRELARGKLRLVGPNCLGIIHPPSKLNASFAASMPSPGSVALLSQSGAILTSILDWAQETHVGFSSIVSVGAMADVDFADLLDYFGDDPQTRSIILYMESIGDVRKFLSAARAVARAKPVIVVKSGRHEAGARAAASHTGALAGADDVFEAAFRRAGILRVITIRELFGMSEILAKQPPPAGPNLAIITNAGGPGVMATDDFMTRGGQLAPLSETTIAALNEALPPFWSHANPIDVLGDATPERYRKAVEICARDETTQGLLVILSPQAMTDPTETARQLTAFARIPGKPVLAAWLGGGAVRPGRDLLNAAGIPNFDAPEGAIRAFLSMVQYKRNQELLYEVPPALPEDQTPDAERVNRIIAIARAEGRTLLTEPEAKEVLAAYGVPVTPTVAARTEEEAVGAARRVGYPVVLKLLSRVITHKSDAGGVQLNLGDDAAVAQAFRAIRDGVAGYAFSHNLPADCFDGVTVQPMVRERGYELIVGCSTDAQFGPVILFGSGGVLVEVYQDRALALPPLNRTLARRLVERTKVYKALQGVRGQRPVDLAALETILANFSRLVTDQAEVAEIDINPLLAGSDRIVALDARVLLTPPGQPADERRLAIRPYPNQYTAPWVLEDGTEVTVRVIRPEDEPLIVALHDTLSDQTIRLRYFSLVRRLNRENLIRLCHLDYERELALVAVARRNGQPQILGVSRYYMEPETRVAEFALLVSDPWQGKGLGRHLLRRLVEIARERGVCRLVGPVLAENAVMLKLVKEMGFRVAPGPEPAAVVAELELG